MNAVAVAGATALSATALLGAPRPACRMGDFVPAAHALVALLRASGVRLTASLLRNVSGDFRESLRWLTDGGLVERLIDSGGVVLHVPLEKRISLDFYKNNIIHFFLVPSLLTRALLTGVPVPELKAHVAWWLDLYRWEFPLPQRDALATEIGRWLAHYQETGALVGDAIVPEHAVVRTTCGILENFREAYLIAARTVAAQQEWPIAQTALTERMRRQFATALLLGEVQKPEGSSMVTFGNALSRFGELGHVAVTPPKPERREPWIDRGPAFDRLPDLIARFGT